MQNTVSKKKKTAGVEVYRLLEYGKLAGSLAGIHVAVYVQPALKRSPSTNA